MGTKSPIAMVDAVIEKLIGIDPSLPTVPAMLLHPIHTIDMVAMDVINIQSHVEVVHNVEQSIGHDNTVCSVKEYSKTNPGKLFK